MWIKKIYKHGGSLTMTIPVAWAHHHNIKRGDFLYCVMNKEGGLELYPSDPRKTPELVERLTEREAIIDYNGGDR